MQTFLLNLNLILAQTPQEKKYTLLYVLLFVFLCLLLVIDSRERKKVIDNDILKKIVLAVFFLSLGVLIVLYFVL